MLSSRKRQPLLSQANSKQEYGAPPRVEETDVGEPGELYGSNAERRQVSSGLPPDSDLVDKLHGMKRNEEAK